MSDNPFRQKMKVKTRQIYGSTSSVNVADTTVSCNIPMYPRFSPKDIDPAYGVTFKKGISDYTKVVDREDLKARVHKFFIPKNNNFVPDEEWLMEAMILKREMTNEIKFMNESLMNVKMM